MSKEPVQSYPTPPQPQPVKTGADVLYVAHHGHHQGLRGDVAYPAKVVVGWSQTCATIAVFTESEQWPVHVIRSANYDADGAAGTWHWGA